MTRPHITPEMVERFYAYQELYPSWGSLHIVLDDDNIETHNVEHCLEWATERKDTEGAALAKILLSLTKTQRGRISRKVDELYNKKHQIRVNYGKYR